MMPTVGARGGYLAGVQKCTRWAVDKDEVTMMGYSQLPNGRHVTCFSGRKGHTLRVLCALVVFCTGLVTGLVVKKLVTDNGTTVLLDHPRLHQVNAYDTLTILHSHMKMERVKSLIREMSSEVHMTGTHANSVLQNRLVTLLQGQGHLDVRLASYTVLLSYPKWELPNSVSLVYTNGSVAVLLKYTGPDYTNHPELAQPYAAFSANDTVQADVVFANYGEERDFSELTARGVACNSNIVIMRLGQIYPWLKVSNAIKCGASGVLLYTEPLGEQGKLASWAAPHVTVLPASGDPTSPHLPSLDGSFRLPRAQARLPTIPVQPLSAEQADQLMTFMAGPTREGCVQGNVTCRLGPGFLFPRNNMQVKLEVNNELEERTISNVLATLRGSVEPDRLVIVGSHYDAWSFAASGSAVATVLLLEVAHTFAQLSDMGWSPRRTLMFVHWDGSQQALMGSTEFVEEHYNMLQERTVAYVSLDTPVQGASLACFHLTPMLHSLAANISQQVPLHFSSQWSEPEMQFVDSADHVPFVYTLGVPAIRPYMVADGCDRAHVHDTPLDTFDHLSGEVDPGFLATEFMLKLVTELLLQLSTNSKLPLDCRELAHFLEEEFDSLHASLHTPTGPFPASMGHLQRAIDNFSSSADDFHKRFALLDDTNSLLVRQHNDNLMKLLQVFIHSPGTPHSRNILLDSGMHSVKGNAFPAIREAFHMFESNHDNSRSTVLWQEVDKQVTIAVLAVQAAIDLLQQY